MKVVELIGLLAQMPSSVLITIVVCAFLLLLLLLFLVAFSSSAAERITRAIEVFRRPYYCKHACRSDCRQRGHSRAGREQESNT